eukprot:scaffold135560_cov18-Prasinocladus_malaysianus.AAC.1
MRQPSPDRNPVTALDLSSEHSLGNYSNPKEAVLDIEEAPLSLYKCLTSCTEIAELQSVLL